MKVIDIVNLLTDPKNMIIPGLYLGSLRSLRSDLTGIDTVISLTNKAYNYDIKKTNIKHYIFPVSVYPTDQHRMDHIIWQIIPIIYHNIKYGNNVLVHCDAGLHRAPTVIVYYLQFIGYSVDAAIKRVRARRPLALSQCPFRLSLY